ncbi:MAG: molybdopterin dehydrogenase FAD-binding [Arthrobacter sp.]|jgi:hypothetical protein|nr:molybdopterin dehydrogenase FAD-binding [Arthrobacter sp.]MCU1520559.1 molybdopterin dehydrogenase FAD-binding [Arthrobacter sp.]MCU1541476.1 molybdopterin dehydrogenase FAD-binding [Arthrobacter sp.]MCU1554664.1 molybdopterin dehydrogenase FAD-binding [Arthrobacter sp.]
MDMNSIEEVVSTTDPAEWRAGDAWLAGGTVLFSYGSYAFGDEPLKRLLDLGAAGWVPVTVLAGEPAAGIELAATCTIAELYALPESLGDSGRAAWPALDLVRPCCDSFVASFKVWNMSTVGGNLCTSLPAGPVISLCAGLDGVATILGPGGTRRRVPVAEFVTGNGTNCLAPGELLRSVHLPASALSSRVAFRRLSLSNLGRSGALLIGRLDGDGSLVLTVTAATTRPVQLRFQELPDAAGLAAALDGAVPAGLYHDDIHGLPAWRRDMTYRLAEEIRAELSTPVGQAARDAFAARVSGDFWPPQIPPTTSSGTANPRQAVAPQTFPQEGA